MVPDYTKASIYVRHSGTDGWGGQYVNMWFDGNEWFARCVNPNGGKIWLADDDVMRLDCAPGDPDNI